MSDVTNAIPEINFPSRNLPPNTQGFFNSPVFAQNEMQFLASYISMMEKAFMGGQQQIKEAIDSQT